MQEQARHASPPPAMTPGGVVARVPMRARSGYDLRLGARGFGGPVALVGRMARDLVGQRTWLTQEARRERLAVCQALPGPWAMQVGSLMASRRGGFRGAWAGGGAVILPTCISVAALGALSVHGSGLPPVTAMVDGVSPAVMALLLHPCDRLAELGMEDWRHGVIVIVACAMTVAVPAEVALLLSGAGLVGLRDDGSLLRGRLSSATPVLAAVPLGAGVTSQGLGARRGTRLRCFVKAGSLTVGRGLVSVPFLEQGLVQQPGGLAQRQFLVAAAIGLSSPGPVGMTATVVGYLVAGCWGSLVSTIGIFPPAFLLVRIVAPLRIRHRANPNVQGVVQGAYGAAIGTILGACLLLGRIASGEWCTALVALLSLGGRFRWHMRTPILVAATAVIGLMAFPLLQLTWGFVKSQASRGGVLPHDEHQEAKMSSLHLSKPCLRYAFGFALIVLGTMWSGLMP
jgi:chromate transporter